MAGDRTESRRDRVRQLWVRSDRQIAETLIEEGYGSSARTAAAQKKQVESMQRNVWNDRKWWRAQWRKEKSMTREDAAESRGEHLAILDSYRADAQERLFDPRIKGTPYAQILTSLLRAEELRAKSLGVHEQEPIEPEGDESATPPIMGLVIGDKYLSKEMKDTLRAQGYRFDEED